MDQNALGIYYLNSVDKDKLIKVYTEVQGTIAATALSMRLKNTQVEGVATRGGTVSVRRLKTSASQAYGTARAAGAGNKLQNNGVDVKIDTDREIVEEIETKDIELYGIGNIVAGRSANHAIGMQVDLDEAYFVALENAASSVQKRSASTSTTGIVDVSAYSTTEDKVLALIQRLESLVNDNVNVVDRAFMTLTLAPKWYDSLKKYINTLPNPNGGGQTVESFHGVEVLSAPRQNFDAIVQVKGAVAQPVVATPYSPSVIPLSNAIAVPLFYSYGTKAVMPDTVFAAALDSSISA